MKLIKITFIFIISFLFLNINTSFAKIDMTVSPIKYELEWEPWTSITKTATLYNYANFPIKIITWKSDFISNGTTWWASFVRYSELVHSDQQLSKWISLSSSWFTIQPNSKHEINFTIDIPKDATPGWHYWAVFFKNNNSEHYSSGAVSIPINVDYWVIILLKVSWEIKTDIEIKEPKLIKWWDYKNNKTKDKNLRDKCPYWDLTRSRYDWKCIDSPKEIIDELTWKINDTNDKKEENFEENNLDNNINNDDENNKWKKDDKKNIIEIEIPIKNKWNTHVKPKGKIILKDENWKQIKRVWKEIVTNKQWLVIGEKIVDYLPINDVWWNVLPEQQRNYVSQWLWFPYEKIDDNWKKIIKYLNPSEYYTNKNIWWNRILMPRERVCERYNTKKITAEIDLSYPDENWEMINYNSAKEFDIKYKEEYVGFNPYIAIFLWIFLLIFFLLWLILFLRKKKCINKDCNKRIRKNMKVCPYCWTKQNEKKKKEITKKTKRTTEKKDEKIKKEKKKKAAKKTKKSISKKEEKTNFTPKKRWRPKKSDK